MDIGGQKDAKEKEEEQMAVGKVGEVEEEKKEEVTEENKEVFKSEEQGSSSDKTPDGKGIEDGSHASSQTETGQIVEGEKKDKDHGEVEKSTAAHTNDVEEQKETENSNDPETTQSDNETKENDNGGSSRGIGNQEEDANDTKERATKESGEEE